MTALWRRVEAALDTYDPDLKGDLEPGASDAAIAAAEAALGVRLPDEYRASVRIHDGIGTYLMDSWQLSPLETVLRRWEMFQSFVADGTLTLGEVARVRAKGPVRKERWNSRWIPIAENGGGDDHLLDLDPAPGGAVGQVLYRTRESTAVAVIAPSFGAYLTLFADDLEAGRYEVVRRNGVCVDFLKRE